MIVRTYKIRLFPTKEQEELIYKHIGCCRFVWNWALETQEKYYKETKKHYSAFDLMNMLTSLKKKEEYIWLNEVSNHSLKVVCRDLDKAYKNFFKSNFGFPKYKSKKKSKISYPVRQDYLYFTNEFVQIEKLKKVKYKTNYQIPLGKETKFYNPRVSLINNKWVLTVDYECENQAIELTNKVIGIDLGIKELAVVAYGDKNDNECFIFKNINKSTKIKKLQKKLKRLQRKVSRKYITNKSFEKTSNILKTEKQIKELYYHIANIRHNYIHQTTHTLVELFPYRVVMEDLNVSGMMKNKHLSKAIGEQNFYEFIRQMKYKCEERGIEFIQVDRLFPSSKTCSSCGCIKSDLKLSDRTFICEHCGNVIDRDYNAAINLMQYVC